MNRKEAIAKAIAQTEALQFGFFKDDKGKPVPYYVDLTKLWSEPPWLKLAADLMESVITEERELQFNRIGGADSTGISLATLISQRFSKPLVVLRRKTHLGTGEMPFLGNLFPGERILVIDDVIATGAKALDLTNLIITEGGLVSAYAVLLDNQEGGSSALAKKSIKLISALKLSEVASILLRMGSLEEQNFSALMANLSKFK